MSGAWSVPVCCIHAGGVMGRRVRDTMTQHGRGSSREVNAEEGISALWRRGELHQDGDI